MCQQAALICQQAALICQQAALICQQAALMCTCTDLHILDSKPASLFMPWTCLDSVLSNNQISALPANVFQGLTSLERLWVLAVCCMLCSSCHCFGHDMNVRMPTTLASHSDHEKARILVYASIQIIHCIICVWGIPRQGDRSESSQRLRELSGWVRVIHPLEAQALQITTIFFMRVLQT